MSLKEKIKPYILSLGLAFCFLLFGGNAFAFNYYPTTYPAVILDGIDYENGVLTFGISLSPDQPTYNHFAIMVDRQVFSYRDTAVTTISFDSPICDISPTTIGAYNYYLAGPNIVHCYLTGMTITYKNNSYVNHRIFNSEGLTKTEIDSYMGTNYLETHLRFQTVYNSSDFFSIDPNKLNLNGGTPFNGSTLYLLSSTTDYFPFPLTPISVDGTCGTANGITPTTIPIPENEACSSGTLNNMHDYTTYEGIVFAWSCLGSGEGTSTTCSSLPLSDPVNGACGTANGQTLSSEPSEENKCSSGATNQSTYTTLNGWTWFCYGLFGGTNVACSATNSGAETPPTTPDTADIPTPTDCDTFTGIDKIVCNFGNTIQGLFLPSSEKLVELQTTMAKVNNVFPFNYLQSIGTAFSNTEITSGTLTMTILNNTDSLDSDFFDMPLFENFKLFMTIMVVLMFTFWAVNYIKHFFK